MASFDSPFAQALLQEGQARGYSPLAIALSLGNAQQESQFNPTAVGDSGTAFGGFQWRGDRQTNLRRTAAELGVDPSDPKAQSAHWFNELDGKYGSEKPYGDALKAARTPEEANNAIISALRPAGWSSSNPEGGHAWQQRLDYGKQAFAALNGTPMADTANLPVQAGSPAGLPGSTGGFNVPPAPQTMWDKFASGGPGALMGMPQSGWNPGDALSGAGIALMARDNPNGAAALAKYMEATAKAQGTGANFSFHYDDKSGRMIVSSPKTGQSAVRQFGAPKPDDKDTGLFQERHDKMGALSRTMDEANEMRGLITSGKLDLGVANRGLAAVRQMFGVGSEQDQMYTRFEQFKENLRATQLMLQKGVQTEGDAVRALNQYFPGMSQYDNRATLGALDKITEGAGKDIAKWSPLQKQFLEKYTDFDSSGTYADQNSKYGSKFNEIEQGFAPSRDKYLKSLGQPAAPTVDGSRATNNGSLPKPDKDGVIRHNGVTIRQVR